MTKCYITNYAVTDGPMARAVTFCETHKWRFDLHVVTASDLCPIGMIEEATDKAIARIEKAGKNE